MKRNDNALMGILVLITIISVMVVTFSLGCAENMDDTVNDTAQDGIDEGENNGGEDADYEYIHETAVVESVEILILESFPVQVHAVAKGYLPDGCTKIDEESIMMELEEDTFNINIGTIRPKDMFCTEAIVPFEQKVVLDVYGLEKGIYTVNVNGIESSFELYTDNIIPE